MRNIQYIEQKIFELPDLMRQVTRWKLLNKTIAFTNGCFDILHVGHIHSISQAAKEADILIVGLNSDQSTKGLKGPDRPINNEQARLQVLASLILVDAVILFDEPTPINLIQSIMPDILVKGGDYTIEQIVGAKEVIANGGRVIINPIVEGYSTTGIIGKIQRLG